MPETEVIREPPFARAEIETVRRTDIETVGHAVAAGWPVTEEIRQRVVDRLLQIIASGDAPSSRVVSAARVLVQCDFVNSKREAIKSSERNTDLGVASGLLRDSLKSPELRAALASAAERAAAMDITPPSAEPLAAYSCGDDGELAVPLAPPTPPTLDALESGG